MGLPGGLPGGSVIKNAPANARDMGLIPGLGSSPGGRNGNTFQYYCLDNSMDRGAWQATVHEVAKCQTWLSDWACVCMYTHTHTHTHTCTHMMVCAFFLSQYGICLCTSLDQWGKKEEMIPDLWPREFRLKESESNWSPNLGQCKFKCPSMCCVNTAHTTLGVGAMIMAQAGMQVTHASQTPPVK